MDGLMDGRYPVFPEVLLLVFFLVRPGKFGRNSDESLGREGGDNEFTKVST
jgi:hypothetical protein